MPSLSDFNGQTFNYKQHGASCLNLVPLSIKKAIIFNRVFEMIKSNHMKGLEYLIDIQ